MQPMQVANGTHRVSPRGQSIVDALARKHDFSPPAVTHLLMAIAAGSGSMAEFEHREFGGAGMWMRGGMIMLSGVSDLALKARVDGLCQDISDRLAAEPEIIERVSGPQSKHNTVAVPRQTTAQASDGFGDFAPGSGAWWPVELGTPTFSGRQNARRYAWFADAHRLAIHDGHRLRIYDTRGHRFNGVSQQQQTDGSAVLVFATARGEVTIDDLALLYEDEAFIGGEPEPSGGRAAAAASPAPAPPSEVTILDAIERLGALKARGLLTQEEFATKKADLLTRL